MVPRHEFPDTAIQPPDPDERRELALEDGSGFSHHLAEITMSGYDPDRQPEARLRDFPAQKHTPSRRGGRSYPEPSDSARDPHWDQPPRNLTPEERASLLTATARLRDTLRNWEDAKLEQQAAEPAEINQLAAVRRARDERRGQRF